MTFRLGQTVLLASAVVAGWCVPARAGESLDRAKQLVREGMAAYSAGNYQRAASAMSGAERIIRKALSQATGARRVRLQRALRNIQYNLCLIYAKLGDTVRSVV